MVFKRLENELIILQPLQKSDFNTLFAVAADKEIWVQHPVFNRYQHNEFTRYFDLLLKTDIAFIIIDKNTSAPIGATSYYQFDTQQNSVAIGYTFLAKAYWGGKYNLSIKTLMLEYAFEHVERVIFHVRSGNLRSQAALKKIGAVQINEYPAPVDPDTMQIEFAIQKTDFLVSQSLSSPI